MSDPSAPVARSPWARPEAREDAVPPIRWGMIGCGDVTEVKSGPGFAKARDSRLVAVMRRRGDLAEDYARRHGVPRWHTDADAIIEASDIDAVYVATRPDTHTGYVLRCAAAGKPVYVEKPMALDLADCVKMVDACEAAKVPLWVAFYRRSLERFTTVKRMVDDGAIGVVQAVAVRHWIPPTEGGPSQEGLDWRRDAAQGGGQFIEATCHTLDLLDFYFGPIAEARAFVDNRGGAFDAEDVVAATFRFESGLVASGTWCYAAGVDDERVEIVGTRGTIRLSVTRARPIELVRDGREESLPVGDPAHVQQPMIQSIVDEMHGKGTCPSTGRSALRTARVLDDVMTPYRTRRR